MRVDSLYSPQFSLFRSYMVSEQFASTWRASVAQTSTGAPVTAERELRHVRTQPLAKVTAREGFQVQRSKLGKTFRGFELWRTKVQGPCPALHVVCSSVSYTLLLSRQRVPWVRRSFSLQICTQHRIMGSFS